MDLKIYQHQMLATVKKYLNLLAVKNNKKDDSLAVNEELKNLLKQIVSINESQKIAVENLRRERENREDRLVDKEETAASDELFSSQEFASSKNEEADDERSTIDLFSQEDEDDAILNSKCDDPEDRLENKFGENGEHDLERSLPSPTIPEDIHDLITIDEFMHSIGLLTLKECDDVIEKRRERHKRIGFSHIFCQSIWEKQETKRKRRDWLVSGSPPQLRRKVRPQSEPSSRQASRGPSPVDGSYSPSSSLSSSPVSPGTSMSNLSGEEMCPMCKQKGATLQCDGCGIFYHTVCVDFQEEKDSYNNWLCPKCESLGMRSSTYIDPLHVKQTKEAYARKEILLKRRALHIQTKAELQAKKQTLFRGIKELKKESQSYAAKRNRTLKILNKFTQFLSTQNCSNPALDVGSSYLNSQEPVDSSCKSSIVSTDISSFKKHIHDGTEPLMSIEIVPIPLTGDASTLTGQGSPSPPYVSIHPVISCGKENMNGGTKEKTIQMDQCLKDNTNTQVINDKHRGVVNGEISLRNFRKY